MIKKSFFIGDLPKTTPLRQMLDETHRLDEETVVEERLEQAALTPRTLKDIHGRAHGLVAGMREQGAGEGGLDAFMHEFDLSNSEGVVLMCLAEALLRIPDAATADKLIKDKIGDADWSSHLGQSGSIFVNASTWALMLTGRVINLDGTNEKETTSLLKRLISRSGEPVIRQAMIQAMRIMGRQFVLGRTIEEAMQRGAATEARGYRYSFDMLGEAAHTAADADTYFKAYGHAIDVIGSSLKGRGVIEGPGISIKLSALHPRYQSTKRSRVMGELVERITELSKRAAG
ncbi:MAG: trifunctional transcriptional regulator/proline dehydrogenase/L-glutamate gamma-semialdehyde dehydrogenase, partial [Rhodospirillaceae bacterium]|nr:trifunctional transcriptional regulator/proline dehydrogenase/L-glutamate gamma-semialdehyde dehydrogenase [Rhodospirillaceae bacterium]